MIAFAMQTYSRCKNSVLQNVESSPVTGDNDFSIIKNTLSNNHSHSTPNDSGISCDENESIYSTESDLEQSYLNSSPTITHDAHMAAVIRDDDKKYFCDNAAWAWHGEFGRLIMATALTYNIDYRLMLFDAFYSCPRLWHATYSMEQIDNAKAQFRCNICGHCWTSMRARCSFYISKPHEGGIVLLRLYTQQCQHCYSIVHPLWYFDEICRVMKNLAFTIHKHFFPSSIPSIYWDMTHNGVEPIRRLLQRKGRMNTNHNSALCEACHFGLCYL